MERPRLNPPRPLPASDKNSNGGGIAFVNGHIIVDCYYRGLTKSDVSTRELAERQIWFRWNSEQQTYTKEYGGSQIALMENLLRRGKDTVTLYRGQGREEAELLLRLQKGDTVTLKEMLNVKRDRVFFTPSEEAAQKWSKGCYIAMTFTEEMLKRSYVGVEYDYLEIAIYDPQVLIEGVKTMRVAQYQAPDEEQQSRGVTSPDGF